MFQIKLTDYADDVLVFDRKHIREFSIRMNPQMFHSNMLRQYQ